MSKGSVVKKATRDSGKPHISHRLPVHELAIILNQLVYMNKWLSVTQIKRYCLSSRCNLTIRRMLAQLVRLDLVERRGNNLYNQYQYKAKPELYKTDLSLVAMVDGRDMQEVSYYTEAEIINKFRQMALDERRTVSISSSEIHSMVQSDKSQESIRLKLKAIEDKGFIKPHLVGRVYEYELDHSRLLNTRTPEVINYQGNELTELFIAHQSYYHNNQVTARTHKSWSQTFKRMLEDGYDIATLRHILAWLPQDKHYLQIIKSPSNIKNLYDKLYPLAYEALSVRKAKRHLYKLLNGLLPSAQSEEQPLASLPVVDEAAAWQQADLWLANLGLVSTEDGGIKPYGRLYKWYDKSLYGVEDVDFEDYVSEARILAHQFITNPPSGEKSRKHPDGWLHFKLNDFMYGKRPIDKDEKEENKTVRFVFISMR